MSEELNYRIVQSISLARRMGDDGERFIEELIKNRRNDYQFNGGLDYALKYLDRLQDGKRDALAAVSGGLNEFQFGTDSME